MKRLKKEKWLEDLNANMVCRASFFRHEETY